MTPTPIDLDALAREWERIATARAHVKCDGRRAFALCAKALRAALAQVSPTGELRAKVEALTQHYDVDHTPPEVSVRNDAYNDAIDAVLALLPATGEPRPAKDAAVYDRLYEAWNALSFDVATMPPAAKDTAITACREELDAVLKGFEGRSFTSWCDAQWADGSGRVSLPPNRPATGEPAPTCATCAERADYNQARDWRPSGLRGMHWAKQPDWELCQRGGKGRCSVWLNGTWHTWDTHGVGGENGREATVEDAFREAEAAMVRQGWAKREPTPAAGDAGETR